MTGWWKVMFGRFENGFRAFFQVSLFELEEVAPLSLIILRLNFQRI
ncbi:hypothetical protein RT41_GL000374 [Lactococcus fujiensis JCM 16395]|uniref:Uncharacterized protein n=1 Tax=Lactococcus fujiensis JCM 16395 TaxID=1291764 RepID=A0A2A5RQ81_9LACT|nr:hypothetical protein RT41_GL000374 [Lactococcus fujiensis JCM 16395]